MLSGRRLPDEAVRCSRLTRLRSPVTGVCSTSRGCCLVIQPACRGEVVVVDALDGHVARARNGGPAVWEVTPVEGAEPFDGQQMRMAQDRRRFLVAVPVRNAPDEDSLTVHWIEGDDLVADGDARNEDRELIREQGFRS